MSSVLFGNTGFQDTNRLRSELRNLQGQVNTLKQENAFLLEALKGKFPEVIADLEALKAAAVEKAELEAENARQAAARERLRQQTTAFNNRR